MNYPSLISRVCLPLDFPMRHPIWSGVHSCMSLHHQDVPDVTRDANLGLRVIKSSRLVR